MEQVKPTIPALRVKLPNMPGEEKERSRASVVTQRGGRGSLAAQQTGSSLNRQPKLTAHSKLRDFFLIVCRSITTH